MDSFPLSATALAPVCFLLLCLLTTYIYMHTWHDDDDDNTNNNAVDDCDRHPFLLACAG